MINKYPDQQFDVILIDGRERVGCFSNSIDKLKKGGIIVLDDSFRIRYTPIFNILNSNMFKKWKIIRYNYGYLQTTTFVKL